MDLGIEGEADPLLLSGLLKGFGHDSPDFPDPLPSVVQCFIEIFALCFRKGREMDTLFLSGSAGICFQTSSAVKEEWEPSGRSGLSKSHRGRSGLISDLPIGLNTYKADPSRCQNRGRSSRRHKNSGHCGKRYETQNVHKLPGPFK